MKKTKRDHSEKHNVIPFQQTFSHLSPVDLENEMEWLDDNQYLSEKGKTFRTRFWELFIKEVKK